MSAAPQSLYPYQLGGSLGFNHPTYVVRQADTDLYDALRSGEFCYVLNSRQTGKSSLRVQTMHRLQAEGITCAEIDLTGIGSQNVTAEQWYGGIIQELVSSLELKINRRTWWRKHNDLPPVQRFSEFIEKVLLAECSQHIVIFVDEIDTVLRLNFKDDFFAVIRSCYNKRADKPEYKRLTFALLGVATPSDLIQDKNCTPFNIGLAIELHGFQLHEAQPLAKGLSMKVSNPQAVLTEVLTWTGGQPFLTQKLCKLVLTSPFFVPAGDEAKWVEDLVNLQVIEHWEANDEPEHLKTIRDRILSKKRLTIGILALYQQILQKGKVAVDNSPEQMELRLSGLVVNQDGKLRLYNRIYESIFDQIWVDEVLSNLRPYAKALDAWRASNYQDESQLLQGQQLESALAWAAHKSLSYLDYQFLAASQELKKLEAERKAKQILTEARQKAERQIRTGSTILVMSLIGAIAAVGLAVNASLRSQRSEIKSLNSSSEALRSSNRLSEALLQSVKAGKQLQGAIIGVPDELKAETASTLQRVINTTKNRLEGHTGEVYSVNFSQDGQILASASEDKTVKLWNQEGKELESLKGHSDRVWSVSFSHNSQVIATASWDKTVKLWDRKGKVIGTLEGHNDWVFSVSFSPDDRTIASVSRDRKVILWNLDDNKQKRQWNSKHENNVVDVSFGPDGKIIATASDDGTAKLWNQNGTLLRTLKGHTNEVNSVSFSPDGKVIATASDDHTTKLWNQNGTLLRTLKGHSERAMSASFSADGKTIATASFDKTVKLWKLDGTLLKTLQGHNDWVWDANFSPDGGTLASASRDRIVRLWPLDSSEPLPELTELLVRGCQLLHGYRKTKPNVQESDRRLCDGIASEKGFDTKIF